MRRRIAAMGAVCALGIAPLALADPTQTVYLPKQPGPVAIVISGASPSLYGLYHDFTKALADNGYYAVLLYGNEILRREGGRDALESAIGRARQAAEAVPGKAAVVGFSLGGGAALAFATGMPEAVSVVIAWYPSTSFVTDPERVAARVRVPTLVLQGERDRYNNCCIVERVRAIEAAARARGAPFELVVYPGAEHGFNLRGTSGYVRRDADDSWRRALEMLNTHHPATGARRN
ncbi:MAG: dienelactone hydrolase family protein [Burkholderiales bacterium]